MAYQYNYYNSGRYPSACLLFKTQLNYLDLSALHRKHITCPLRAQQVNALWALSIVLCFTYKHDVTEIGFCPRLQVEPGLRNVALFE
jgi:hypothetical protein